MTHKRILVISDLHIPYHHKDSFEFLREIKKEYKPDFVVNIGDLLDFHAISMHSHDPDLYSAGHELDKSKEEPIPKADNSSPSTQLNTVDLEDWVEDPEPSAIITLPYRSITLQCK